MSISTIEFNGSNVFHSLAALGQPKQVLKILSTTQKKAVATGLSSKDKNGRTPLHVAAYCGNVKVLKCFLDAFPDAGDIRDNEGNNAKDALLRPSALAIGDPADQKSFQRLIRIDKLGFEHQDFGQGPMDVWDAAISNNSIVVAAQPTWEDNNSGRKLFAIIKGQLKQLDLGSGNIPRYVATSNVHSLVLTADKCFAWGKNINGVLGLDVDEKIITTPKAVDETFVEYVAPEKSNTFSALGRSAKSTGRIKDPLIGVACCDFYSLCYTTTKIWCWGINRGQMMNKAPRNTVVDTPLSIYESPVRISSVKCCDSAICVLLSNGQVQLLHNSKVSRLQINKSARDVKSIATSGDYLVVQTDQGKLLRHTFRGSEIDKESSVILWIPRKPKDEVTAFDVADNGSIVVATRSSILRVEEGKEISEFKSLKGLPVATLKSDPQSRTFIAVSNVISGLTSGEGSSLFSNDSYGSNSGYIHWESIDSGSTDEGDLFLSTGNSTLCVHSALLYARCPSLRPLILEVTEPNNPKSVGPIAVPGGSTIFRKAEGGGKSLVVEYAPINALSTFVASLYYSWNEPKPDFEKYLDSGHLLHEYNALQRLITRDLGQGMWEARIAGIGCDVILQTGISAHSSIIAAASPVIAVQLARWSNGVLDDPALSNSTTEDVLRYAYTMELKVPAKAHSECDEAQRLFDLWQVADELLMSNLSDECERKLFEMINFEYVLPFLKVCPPSSRLFAALLDIICRHFSFFIPTFGDFGVEASDAIERKFKATGGTEPIDNALADAYEVLKSKIQSTRISPNSKKTRSGSTISNSRPQMEELTVSSNSKSVPSKLSTKDLSAVNGSPWRDQSGAINKSVSASVTQKSLKDSGWIQARKKSRVHGDTDKGISLNSRSHSYGTTLTPSSSKVGSPSANAGSPDGSPSTGLPSLRSEAASSLSSQRLPARSLNVSAVTQNTSKLVISPSSSPQKSGQTHTSLSDNLPSLGSKPRTASGTKGPRPKFNQKNIKQFSSPLLFAENLAREKQGQSQTTPWKQMPSDVKTSQSVLEKLERVHQIKNRKLTGGSVWGV